MSLQVRGEFFRGFETWVDDIDSGADLFDRSTNIGVMCTSEHDCLDIGVEFWEVIWEYLANQCSFKNPGFDQGNEFWCCDFMDTDRIINHMNPLFVGVAFDGGLSRKDSDFSVTSFDDIFCSGDSDSEYFTAGESDLLEILDGMGGCGITGKDDDSRTLFEQKFHALFRISSDRCIIEASVGTSGIISEIEIVIFWKYFSKFSQNRESADPGVKKSNHKEDFSG